MPTPSLPHSLRPPCKADMTLVLAPDNTCEQCARCEGWRFALSLDDGICQACYRELAALEARTEEEDASMPISIKMFYDHLMWHFQKELRDKVRGTRLIFSPFSVAALSSFREFMMSQNQALYIRPPKQVAGKRGGRRVVWQMVVEDEVHFSSALFNPNRDKTCQGMTGELRDKAYVCWVPPLTFVLTLHRHGDRLMGACVISCGSARMTGLGISFSPKSPRKPLTFARIAKFMGLAAFRIQQDRMEENASRQQDPSVAQIGMLDHSLLLMAIKHAS